MNDKIKKAAATAKESVVRHKTKICVITTVYICGKIHMISINQHNEFLKEHGLYDEFYTPLPEDMEEVEV